MRVGVSVLTLFFLSPIGVRIVVIAGYPVFVEIFVGIRSPQPYKYKKQKRTQIKKRPKATNKTIRARLGSRGSLLFGIKIKNISN